MRSGENNGLQTDASEISAVMVSCQSVVSNVVSVSTHCIDLVKSFPLFVRHPNSLGSLDRPLHVTSPDLQVHDTLTPDVLTQSRRKLREKTITPFIHYLNLGQCISVCIRGLVKSKS